MILWGIGFIEREYKKVQKKLTIFHILAKNEPDNILYQYLQKKYPKRDNVKNDAGFYFKRYGEYKTGIVTHDAGLTQRQ